MDTGAKEKTIGVFLNTKFHLNPKNNLFYSEDSTALFFCKIASNFDKAIIFVPTDLLSDNQAKDLYCVSSSGIKIVPIAHYDGNVYRILPKLHKLTFTLWRELGKPENHFDILWQVNCPNPLNVIFDIFCIFRKIPVIFFIRQEIEKILSIKHAYWRKIFYIVISRLIECVNNKFVHRSFTFVFGEKVYEIYKKKVRNIDMICDNLLEEKDLVHYGDMPRRFNDNKIHILYCGRLEKEKGVVYLLQAVEILVYVYKQEVELFILGSGSQGEFLKRYVKERNMDEYIYFKGFITQRAEYFDYFRRVDIYVQPSLTEGVPKTILEAISKGLPVIATWVGGVQFLYKSGIRMFMVDPCSAEQIAESVLNVRNKSEIAQEYVKNNLDRINAFLFEPQRDKVVNISKLLCK